MTRLERTVKRRLRQRRRQGVRPWSLYQVAQMRGCSRSALTMALQEPTRFGPTIAYLKQLGLVEDHG